MKSYKKYNGLKLTGSIVSIFTFAILSMGCKKLIETDTPYNQLESATAFTDSVTAQATMTGVYAVMYNTSNTGTTVASTFGTYLTTFQARSADELYAPGLPADEYVNNNILPDNALLNSAWNDLYKTIYHTNTIIKGMEASPLSATLKKQLIAEAKFIRAYCHYHLVNLWGPVPLVTETNVNITSVQGQATVAVVYAQIIQDLKDAQADLAADYSWSANIRTRANRWAATAMLAKVYLETKEWTLAEQEASKVIANSTFYTLPSLSAVFLKASPETIWAFNTNLNGYTYIARALLPGTATSEPALALTPSLVNAFERDAVRPDYQDDRFNAWTRATSNGTRYGYKYISNVAAANTEFAVVLRLAEQYLIRAEARVQQNNLSAGITDLNVIRSRAGLHGTFATTQADLLLAIENERRIELFLENGARWYDLKRTGRANEVLGPLKGAGWQATDVLYPIPTQQILANPNLKPNPGYN
jgi:hypothetical protein